MIPHVGTVPDGTLGFDCNTKLNPSLIEQFVLSGFKFVVRYVRRATTHTFDVSTQEVFDILNGGLGLMLVQHVSAPGWTPTGALGAAYGDIAAFESKSVGIPPGVSLWCDLEGVSRGAQPRDIIAYCNEWYTQVARAGFRPGLYVGDSAGLNGSTLYRALKFESYWSAYNLNRTDYPDVRGVQMRQGVSQIHMPIEYDTDVIHADAKGDTPSLLLPL